MACAEVQAEVVAFLLRPEAWTSRPPRVEHVETHGAHVFLAGTRVLKIKRARDFGYMDYSTLDLRAAACRKEVEINRRLAPAVYLGVIAITREADGNLAIAGSGPAVEWAVEMRRFPEHDILSHVAARGELSASLVKSLAATVLASHQSALANRDFDVMEADRKLVASLCRQIPIDGGLGTGERASRLEAGAAVLIGRRAPLIASRRSRGFVRRCHGDLHLNNCVLIDGKPTLFDAIEFDDRIATVDVLHDLAFLLMDLDAAGRRPEANLLLGHYLWLDGSDDALEGLALLPLFLALRAAVRAMVGFQRARIAEATSGKDVSVSPEGYLDLALSYTSAESPRLVAVGGFSGTGKSTLAAALAPRFGAAPGAVHLRSDLERKHLAGVGETDRLPAPAYTSESSAAVYDRLLHRARIALAAGRSVIVDAVFRHEHEREAIASVAFGLGVPFEGVWLSAPAEVLMARVGNRFGDASDATPQVARAQIEGGAGVVNWTSVDASGTSADALAAATRALRLG